MSKILVFYVTHPNEKHAHSLNQTLVNEGLIACSNTQKISSCYMWKNELYDESEFVSIMKTRLQLENRVVERIEELHEYETPCIIRWEVNCNSSYFKWVKEQTRTRE